MIDEAQTIQAAPHQRQTRRFLFLYAMAVAGGSVAYVPLLTLLLPARMADLFAGEAVASLAYIAFGGAITASIANIGFGWLSDITQHRRGWVALGLIASSLLLVTVREVESFYAIIAIIICWQIALNMMLSPLAAWAGDCVPDEQKGLLGGLLSIAPAMGAAAGALITIPRWLSSSDQYYLIAGLVIALVTPVLLAGRPLPMPQLMQEAGSADVPRPKRGKAVSYMWIARLLV